MRLSFKSQALLLLAFVSIGLMASACGTAPAVVYYTLDPLPQAVSSPPAETASAPERIGIGPVRLPTYLARDRIITRAGDHTLTINDFHRWAGPLDEEIQRVLVAAVGTALPGAEILSYPWNRRNAPASQVQLRVQRFDAQPGGQVRLRGSWALTCGTAPERDQQRSFDIAEAVNGTEMPDLVAAQNRALGTLSGDIVAALCVSP